MSGPSINAALRQSIAPEFRDHSKEMPVNDTTFVGLTRQFIYYRAPIGARIEKTLEIEGWKAEVVSIDAGYNNERLLLYVFLPKSFTAPLQPVVFRPGSNGIHESTFDPSFINNRLAFISTPEQSVAVRGPSRSRREARDQRCRLSN